MIKIISNQNYCQTVIQKGTLSVVYEHQTIGQVAYILDENNKICKKEDTGINFQNKFYPADIENKGRIVIPYGPSEVKGTAILMNQGYSEKCNFTSFPEDYSIIVDYILPPESLLVTNTASLIIRPTLLLNNKKMKLEILKSTKVTIYITSYSFSDTTNYQYNNLELSSDKDLELNFTVPASMETMKVEFETSVFMKSQNKPKILFSTHEVNLKTSSQQLTFFESHLRKIMGRYIFLLLGKNGEPIPYIDVYFTMSHILYSNSNTRVSLTTNEKGEIDLGPLNGIDTVKSSIFLINSPVFGYWKISNISQRTSFPERFDILQGEELEFPFLKALEKSEFSRSTFSLMKYSSRDFASKNCFEMCKLIPAKGGSPELIKISNFRAGHYRICFKEINLVSDVYVHIGTYWNKEKSHILKKGKLIELNSTKSIPHIKVKKAKFNEKSMTDEYSLKLVNSIGNVRVHIMARNFISSNDFGEFWKIRNTFEK